MFQDGRGLVKGMHGRMHGRGSLLVLVSLITNKAIFQQISKRTFFKKLISFNMILRTHRVCGNRSLADTQPAVISA